MKHQAFKFRPTLSASFKHSFQQESQVPITALSSKDTNRQFQVHFLSCPPQHDTSGQPLVTIKRNEQPLFGADSLRLVRRCQPSIQDESQLTKPALNHTSCHNKN